MNLFGIAGHDDIREKLERVIKNDRVANAYLFFGPEGVGKEGFALEFAAMLNCLSGKEIPCGICSSCRKMKHLEHPNLTLIYPLPRRSQKAEDSPLKGFSEREIEAIQEEIRNKAANPYEKIQVEKASSILINSIREIRRTIYLTAPEEGYKVIIIFQAHLMNIQSVNALLKVLEEPPERSTFILTTSHINRVLPTIRSRCQPIYFPFLSKETIAAYLQEKKDVSGENAELAARLSGGSVAEAIVIINTDFKERFRFLEDLIQGMLDDDSVKLKSTIDNLEAIKKRDPAEFKSRMQILLHWLRDTELYRQGISAEMFSYPGMAEKTAEFMGKFPDMDSGKAALVVEKCIDSVERNVYIRLALLAMVFELNRIVKQGSGIDGL